MQWSRVGLGMTRLGHIFISHSHGDHCFGLPGLISTMGLLGRTADLHLHAPADLRPFVECVLEGFCKEMDYKVYFHEVDTRQYSLVHEDRSVEVWSLPNFSTNGVASIFSWMKYTNTKGGAVR